VHIQDGYQKNHCTREKNETTKKKANMPLQGEEIKTHKPKIKLIMEFDNQLQCHL